MSEKNASIWTPANIVTVARIALVPLWLLAAEMVPAAQSTEFSWAGFGVFIFYAVLALTDSLDGYLARSRNEVSDFGKFLDPIADKLVVVVSLAFLLENAYIPSWVMLIVVGREFLVSGLRMVVASKGPVIAASMLGKLKTAFTMISIGAYLLQRCMPAGQLHDIVLGIAGFTMVAAMVLTLWSGYDYFRQCWKYVV